MNLIGDWKFLGFNGILSVLFGLFLIINPSESFNIGLQLIGIFIIILSSYLIINEAFRNKTNNYLSIVLYIALLLIGIFISTKPEAIIDLLFILIGIYMISYGIINLYNSFKLKPASKSKKRLLHSGLIYSLVGVFLIFANNFIEAFISTFIGSVLLIIGIIIIYFANEMRKDEL